MATISNAKILAITVLGIAIGWVVVQAAPALQPAIIAVMVAYLLNPLVEQIEKKLKVGKYVAVSMVTTAVIIGFFVLVGLIVLPILDQTAKFTIEFQTISENINQVIEEIFAELEKIGFSQAMIGELKKFIAQTINWLGTFAVSALTSVLGFIFKIFDLGLILILSIYFLASGKKMVQYLMDCLPKSLHQSVLGLIEGTDQVVWSYLKTQALIALIIGVLSTIAFMVIGIRFSFLLGVLAGILNFIPYFGSILAGVLAVLVALLTSGVSQSVVTLIVVLFIQQVEGNFITPRLQGKSSHMHPAVVMIVIVVGNHFWGTLGMFLAVPLFGLTRLIISEAVKLIKQMS